MNSFYGGLPGKSFELAQIFNNGAEMEEDLNAKWKSPIGFGEFVLISYGFPAEAPDYLKWDLKKGDKPITGIRYKDADGKYPIIPEQVITKDNIDKYKDNAFIYGNKYTLNQMIDANRAFDKYNYNATFWQKICYTRKEDAFTVYVVKEGENPADLNLYELNAETGVYSLTLDTAPIDSKTYYKMTDSENRYIHVVQVNEDTLIAYKLLATMTGTTPVISTLDFDCLPNTKAKTYMILDGDDVSGEMIDEMREGLLDPSALSNIELREASMDTPILVVKKPRAAKFFYGDELGVLGDPHNINKDLVEYYDQTQLYVHYSQAEGKYVEATEDKVEHRLYYNSFDVAGMGIDDFYVNKRNGYIYQVTGEKDSSWILTYQGCFKWIPDVVANEQARYDANGDLTELIQPKVETEIIEENGIRYDKGKITFSFREEPIITADATTGNAGGEAGVTVSRTHKKQGEKEQDILNLLFEIPRGEAGPGVFKVTGIYEGEDNYNPQDNQQLESLRSQLETNFGYDESSRPDGVKSADGNFIAVNYKDTTSNKIYSYLFYKTSGGTWNYILVTGVDGIIINGKSNTDYGDGANYVYSKKYLDNLVYNCNLQIENEIVEQGMGPDIEIYNWQPVEIQFPEFSKYGTYCSCTSLVDDKGKKVELNIKSNKPLIICCDEVEHPEYSIISHVFLKADTNTLIFFSFSSSVLEASKKPKTIPLTIIELP